MPRKRLTPEEKAARKESKKAEARRKYAIGRDLGLTRDELRSVGKAAADRPEIAQEAGGLFTRVFKDTTKLFDKIGETLTGEKSGFDQKEAEPKRRRTGTRGTTPQGKQRADSFTDFLARNPDLGKNEAVRAYRAESPANKIGNDRANDLYRAFHNRERDVTKVTKIKYYSNKDYPLIGNESVKEYIKARYIYFMQYEVELDNGTSYTDWLHIASDQKLTYADLIVETQGKWNDEHEKGVLNNKYVGVRILAETIELIRAVDTKK